MSAVCVNFRDVARKFARIFKVCNTLYMWWLCAFRFKIDLKGVFIGVKFGIFLKLVCLQCMLCIAWSFLIGNCLCENFYKAGFVLLQCSCKLL